MFQQGDWAFSLDLKSGYHHIDIHEDSQTILGFSWGYEDCCPYLGQCCWPSNFYEPCLGSNHLFEDQGLYAVINQHIFWSDKLPLSVETTHEVVLWLHHIDQFNGQPIWFSLGITCKSGLL